MKTSLTSYDDPITGRKVTRLTDLTEHCHHPYFYNKCFTPDNEWALIAARENDISHIRLVNIETGEINPLVSGEDIGEFMVTLNNDGNCLYYSQGHSLYQLDLKSKKSEPVWKQQEPWTGGIVYPGFSDDYRYALFAQMHRDDVLPKTGGWSFFEPQYRKKPRCRLVLVDIGTGKEKVLLEEACWLGHPQICPGNPNMLMFCHEGPGNLIDARVWLIDSDGCNQRCMGYHEETPGAGAPEYITHECFMPDGKSIIYIRIGRNGKKNFVGIRSVKDFSVIKDLEVENYLHVGPSPDSRFLAGDGRGPDQGPGCIWLLNLETDQEEKLCLHGSSYKPRGTSTQDAHPHPAFSNDGKKILFSSDREQGPEGNCAVYLVERD